MKVPSLESFGAGLFAWPHGIFVDHDGNVWVTDAVGYAPVPDGWGHVVYKFSPEGELLMTLGQRGVAGDGPDTFNKPSAVLVAPNGDIFIADGHDVGGNNRIGCEPHLGHGCAFDYTDCLRGGART